ncbi:MAG: hypothetical protein J7K65_02175 [Planctomycetes bacterium]|nr:hypothetical protein [Planctomycetota bacterium]
MQKIFKSPRTSNVQIFKKQRNERTTELLDQQKQIIEQICEIQKQYGVVSNDENISN